MNKSILIFSFRNVFLFLQKCIEGRLAQPIFKVLVYRMTINYKTKPSNQDIASLYYLIGEAVCMIQHLEGALCVSITLKKDVKYPRRIPQKEANGFLKNITLFHSVGPLGLQGKIIYIPTFYITI